MLFTVCTYGLYLLQFCRYCLFVALLSAQCSSWSSMHLGPISASLWQLLFTPCFSWRHFLIFSCKNSFEVHESHDGIFLEWISSPCCSHKYWKGLKKGENKWGGFIFAFCESPEPTWERAARFVLPPISTFCQTEALILFKSVKGFHVIQILIFMRFKYNAATVPVSHWFCHFFV